MRKLVSATPCRSTRCSRTRRYPRPRKKGFAVMDASVYTSGTDSATSSASHSAVAMPLL